MTFSNRCFAMPLRSLKYVRHIVAHIIKILTVDERKPNALINQNGWYKTGTFVEDTARPIYAKGPGDAATRTAIQGTSNLFFLVKIFNPWPSSANAYKHRLYKVNSITISHNRDVNVRIFH